MGGFSGNETIEDITKHYTRKSNSARAFVEEKLEYTNDPKTFLLESELYHAFIKWCIKEDLPSVPKATFTKAMQEFCPDAKQTKQRILGKPTPVWQFVKYYDSVPTAQLKIVKEDNQEEEKKSVEEDKRSDIGTEGTTLGVQTSSDFPLYRLEDVKEILRLKEDFGINICCCCGKNEHSTAQLNTFNPDKWNFLCEECAEDLIRRLGEVRL